MRLEGALDAAELSPWQFDDGRCDAVLYEVFSWLSGGELARAGAVCRAWRRAAAAPALWRRLVPAAGRGAGPGGGPGWWRREYVTLAAGWAPAGRAAVAAAGRGAGPGGGPGWWRREYVTLAAGWAPAGRAAVAAAGRGAGPGGGPGWWRREYVTLAAGWAPAGRAAVAAAGQRTVHAALSPGGSRLALLADDGSLTIWERSGEAEGAWRPAGGGAGLGAVRGWRTAVRLHWPAGAPGEGEGKGGRLLLVGALALADSWELLVVNLDEGERREGVVSSRARCSAGGAGCWVDARGEAFLSLELTVLAPRLACTTVWLNASTQETQSEYAGVTAPLLRIYNEGGAHITFVSVVQVPLDALIDGSEERDSCSTQLWKDNAKETCAILMTGSGCRATSGGTLCAWALSAVRPPPVVASTLGDLRERVRRRADTPRPAPAPEAAPAPAPEPPSEASVRALCEPPEAECTLPAPPVGLVVHPSGRCVWTALLDGSAWCASLPRLVVLRCLTPPAARPMVPLALADSIYYVQPDVSDIYFASPCVRRGGGGVAVWSVRSGGPCVPPPPLALASPPLAALLPPPRPARPAAPAELLVLTADTLYVWRSRASLQSCLDL